MRVNEVKTDRERETETETKQRQRDGEREEGLPEYAMNDRQCLNVILF